MEETHENENGIAIILLVILIGYLYSIKYLIYDACWSINVDTCGNGFPAIIIIFADIAAGFILIPFIS